MNSRNSRLQSDGGQGPSQEELLTSSKSVYLETPEEVDSEPADFASISSSLQDAEMLLNNPIEEEIVNAIKKQRKTVYDILHQPRAATNDYENCVRML